MSSESKTNENTERALEELKEFFGTTSTKVAIKKALMLAKSRPRRQKRSARAPGRMRRRKS